MRMKLITRAAMLIAFAAAATGCSKQPVQQTPLVTSAAQQSAPPEPPSPATITATIDAAGLTASYEASFDRDKLERIVEKREAGSAEYEFKGARLLRYSGASLHGPEPVELRMDVNGKVLSATAGSGPLSQEQISEITSRAQLLRSHALAQAAVRSHQ
jgi:hypothetical protein